MLPLLNVSGLSIDFASGGHVTHALDNVSFTISRGEILALVGESGSGKSITALSILQLLPAQLATYPAGSIFFSEDGITQSNLLGLDEKELMQLRGNRVSMIFQEPMTSLNPVFTCGDQVMEALRSHKRLSFEEARARAIAWFEKVQLPEPATVFDKYPHQLSGGQKQRVMIAMAMCCEPALLICDEPTTALDVTVQKNILRIIRELQQETGMAVIFITHDLAVVSEIADRTVVMYKGSVVEQQTTQHLFTDPVHAYTKGLLACRPVLHQKGFRLPVVSDFLNADAPVTNAGSPALKNDHTGEAKDQDGSANNFIKVYDTGSTPLSRAPAGKDTSGTPLPRALPATKASTEVIMKVEKLSVLFPLQRNLFGRPVVFTKAVDDVSFEVYRNETLGLVGGSGCGKTTLGRTLLRLIEPSSGRIMYNGKDYSSYSGKEMASLRREIQIIFQDPYSSLNPRLSIGNAIAEPIRFHGILTGRETIRKRVEELLGRVGLDPSFYNRYPHEFSGGQRQRIVIARALAMNPKFIVCDESVSALDVSIQAQVLNLLNDLRAEFGFTVIFISHDLSVVRYISDRIMVMQKGKIVETGEADQVYFNPQNPYTRQLIASIPKGFPTQ